MPQIKLSNAQLTRIKEAERMRERQVNAPEKVKYEEFIGDIVNIIMPPINPKYYLKGEGY